VAYIKFGAAAEANISRLDAERELETIELQMGFRDAIEAGEPPEGVSAEQPPEMPKPNNRARRAVARVCPTRGCARVIPYGEGNYERHRHGSAWKDAPNVWVLEKAREFYHSVRNNRADPPRPPPPRSTFMW
jgi:hypothetical protein